MRKLVRAIFLLCVFTLADFTNPPCTIELECAECIPDNMPLVTSHRASNGSVVVQSGEELMMACSGGKFLEYPMHESVTAVCEDGLFRVRQDSALRHLLELGCQENLFEDVLHQVEFCGPPLQGRAYQILEPGTRTTRHLAMLCFDEDRAITLRTHVCNSPRNQLRLPPHNEQRAPLSLLGNFNHMFDAKTRHDAEKLYSDDVSLNKRLQELFKHEKITFAGQTLTSAKLLSSHYFDDQNMRVTDFVSNRVAIWKSVAKGNMAHLHQDIAKLMKLSRPHTVLDVYVGTHGVMSLRSEHNRKHVFLKSGNRFPVPKYIWNVVYDKQTKKALAVVLLNDPFIAVSEIRDAVFCESQCGSVSWLHELRRNRNYEVPTYGLVFCCSISNFTDIVPSIPREVIQNVAYGNEGMLTDLFNV